MQAVKAQGGRALAEALHAWVHGREELPLDEVWPAMGLQCDPEPRDGGAVGAAALGLRLTESPLTGVRVRSVLAGSAAAAAGLSAGDEVLGIDGWRVRKWDDARQWLGNATVPFDVLVSRQQRLWTLRVDPSAGDRLSQGVALKLAAKPRAAALARRRDWLGA